MKRQLTAFVTIVALALAGAAGTPAEARDKNSDDVIKLLLGAAAVGLLLNQLNKGKPAKAMPRRGMTYQDDWDGAGYGQNSRRAQVPAECVLVVTVNGSNREVVSARCMKEFGLSRYLPEECAFGIRTGAGLRTVYGPQCLRDNGYRIEQARY